jgi:hypothetical protein
MAIIETCGGSFSFSFPDIIMHRIQKGKIMRKLGLVIFLVYEQGANRRENTIPFKLGRFKKLLLCYREIS